jgi:hypothetical protein
VYATQLADAGVKELTAIPDNDAPARKYVQAAAADCHAAGITVRVVTLTDALPDLPEHGDVSDFLAARGEDGTDELLGLAAHAKAWAAELVIEADFEPRLLTLREALARIGTDSDWLVDKMLAVGDMSLWVAKPGFGKSALLRELSACVAYGAAFLGRATRQGQVVYLALEGARATIRHLEKLGIDLDDPRVLLWLDEVNQKDPVAWLRQTLASVEPALIVVGCLFDFTTVKDNASNAGYSAIYSALGRVLRWERH